MNAKPGVAEWYVWGGATLAVFAVLETRAIRSNRATLSHVCRTHARRSPATKAATAGFAAWFAWHILFERLS